MADKEIGTLTSASTPLVGTEITIITQGANSRKVTTSAIAQSPHTQAWGTITGTPTTLSGYGITDAQPLDTDLTAIAALTTTGYGRAFLALADEAAFKAYVNLEIGTDVQAQGATLTSLEGLSLVNGDLLYSTGADALARRAIGSSGQVLQVAGGVPTWATVGGTGDLISTNNLSDVASAATSRANLGLAIGTNVQAFSSNLSTLAAVTPGATGLALLDDTTQAAAYTTLGTVPDANLPVRLSVNASLVTNIDTITETGWFRHALGATGQPIASAGFVEHYQYNANRIQNWYQIGAIIRYTRFYNGTSWSAWTEIGVAPMSAYAKTLLDDTTATAARTTLGAGVAGASVFTAVTTANIRDILDVEHVINPQWYGVVGDGVANDAAALQACVTAANGRGVWIDGLNIRVPTGNEITLPSLGLNLGGAGRVTYEGTGNLFKGANITTTPFNFTATALQTTFVCAYTYRGPYVEVFVNSVRVSHRTYSVTRNGTNVTVVFNAGQTLGAAVRVDCARIDVAGVLDGFATVRIGSGVEIVTTQVNEGRAFALGWNDTDYEKRQDPRFVMEAGAVIKGVDGTKGFKNAVWMNAVQNARVFGEIYGIGANIVTATEVDYVTCPYAFYMTGAFTPSDLKMVGGMIGFYDKGVAAIGDTFEGLSAYGWTFLNCGQAVYWPAPTSDQGLLLTMNGCHANCVDGIIYTDNVSTVLLGDNDFFQGPLSTAIQFIFVSVKGSELNTVHDNEMVTYKPSAVAYGVVFDSAARLGRVHDNLFAAIDATGTFIGTVCLSGSSDNVIGPNTYKNIDRAVEARSGSLRIGAITGGDVFQSPPGVLSRYEMVGSNGWLDQKWLNISNASAQSVATATLATWTYAETSDPESLYAGGTLTAPAWARRVRIKGVFNFAANATGYRFVRVVRNGSSVSAAVQAIPNVVDNGAQLEFDQEFAVNGGDTFVFQLYQNSGVALNLLAGSAASVLFS